MNINNTYTPWCVGTFITNSFKFITYSVDTDDIDQDVDFDKIYVYTITNNTTNEIFTSYFIIPSLVTQTFNTFIGDSGVCYKKSQGWTSGIGGGLAGSAPWFSISR